MRCFATLAVCCVLLAHLAEGQSNHLNDLESQALQLVNQGRFREALKPAGDAVEEAKAAFGDQSLNYGIAVNGLGFVQMGMGSYDEAEKNLLLSESVIAQAIGTESPTIMQTLANLANLYMAEAHLAESNPTEMNRCLAKAESYCTRTYQLMQKLRPADDPAQVAPLEGLAQIYAAERKFADAKSLVEHSLRIELSNLPPGNVQVLRTRNEIAWLKLQLGDRSGAISEYRETLSAAESSLGGDNPITVSIREGLRTAQGGHL